MKNDSARHEVAVARQALLIAVRSLDRALEAMAEPAPKPQNEPSRAAEKPRRKAVTLGR
jgi:hypothetical protein